MPTTIKKTVVLTAKGNGAVSASKILQPVAYTGEPEPERQPGKCVYFGAAGTLNVPAGTFAILLPIHEPTPSNKGTAMEGKSLTVASDSRATEFAIPYMGKKNVARFSGSVSFTNPDPAWKETHADLIREEREERKARRLAIG